MTESQQETIVVFNQLHVAEMNTLLPRLLEMNLSVSWAAAPLFEVAKKLAEAAREHREWLVEAIQDQRGAVWPVTLDPRTANLHYLSLDAITPMVIRNLDQLVRNYQQVASNKSLTPDSAELISRIGRRYDTYLRQLQDLCSAMSVI